MLYFICASSGNHQAHNELDMGGDEAASSEVAKSGTRIGRTGILSILMSHSHQHLLNKLLVP